MLFLTADNPGLCQRRERLFIIGLRNDLGGKGVSLDRKQLTLHTRGRERERRERERERERERQQGFVFQKRSYRSVVNGTPIAGHKCSQVTLEVSILGAFFVSVAKHEQCVSCSTLSISRDDSFWVARHRQCSAQFV